MTSEFKIPDLGEGVEEGDVVNVHVAIGDTLKIDQPVLELETGKATVDIPSDVSGTITELLVKAGDKIRVGQPILKVAGEDTAPADNTPPAQEARPAADVKETDAAEFDKGDAPLTPSVTEGAASPAPVPVDPVVPEASHLPVRAAPSVRKFAREIGIDVTSVPTSDPDGRITTQDVKAYAKQRLSQTAAPAGGPVAAPPLPDFSTWGEVEREPMNTVRKITARHMTTCWSSIPHVTQHDKADITKIEKIRKEYSAKAEKSGGRKLTPTAVLLRITASALRVFPTFNASLDTTRQEIIRKKYIHIGVAVDTPKGLIVPVIRDADQKNIIELSAELNETAEQARNGKINPDQLQGGSFTLSNIGGIGGSHFTPIINYPEVAILGIGRATYEPVYHNGEFQPRLMMPLSLSYDHRLIDGAEGARFIRWIADAIAEPALIALEG